jgi:undecaprenyl-diphosphatase
MSRRARYGVFSVIMLLGPFGVLTAVVLVTAPGVLSIDAHVADWWHRPALEHPAFASTLRVIGLITEPIWLRVIALAVALLLWRRGLGRAAAWLVATMAIGGMLGIILKQIFARSRPEWPEAITVISGYSYPSGHAVNSMLAAGCAIVLLRPLLETVGRRRLWTVVIAYVLLVGFDRVALGVHYLTDVLGGWALALTVLSFTLAAFPPQPRSHDAPAIPAAGLAPPH